MLASEYPTAALRRAPVGLSIGEFMSDRLGGSAEVGDRVNCGDIDLIVRDVDPKGAISEVGLVILDRPRRIPLFFNGSDIAEWLRRRWRRG